MNRSEILQPPEGYTLRKQIHSGRRSAIYSAVRERDRRELVLKSYLDPEPMHAEARAGREFEALCKVAGPGIPRVVELQSAEGHPLLVTERVPGISLEVWAGATRRRVEDLLEVAIALAEVLSRIHSARLLHCDVSPANVLVDPKTQQTHLLDFAAARRLGSALRREELPVAARGRRGSLSYLAPEATGRMGRGLDVRSDLYSLGATLYFAFTGRPPFEGDNPLALIHAHMARVPVPASELRASLPLALARIASKLLQKTPEDRYQTAAALAADLRECREHWQRTGGIPPELPLGRADAVHRPLFAKRLYGREAELARLQQSYASALERRTALLLTGPPGIGKSELVHALRASLVASGGYLALGKFDQFRRSTPYAGFAGALASLAEQILTESDARLQRWRSELRGGLGAIAGALVGLVPQLSLVLGDVVPVPLLGPAEMRARLALAVRCLIRAAATPDHPLVLCLEDLQWADAGSRDLLRSLLLEDAGERLLLLGSYRDGEVDAAHPLSALLDELRGQGVALDVLPLAPLAEHASAQMLADALARRSEDTGSLAAFIALRTGNAPLRIQQFVHHLYDVGLLRFELGVGWTWDEVALVGANIPDDAVELILAKLGRLPGHVAAVLELASCAGDTFDPLGLAELAERPREQIESGLFALCDEGLIAPSPHGFRFAHDRIREAAQQRLSSEKRAALHQEAARLLLARTAPEQLDERVFEIADHLLHAGEPVGDAARRRALDVHLRAGKRALVSGASVTAVHYLAAARQQFAESQWSSDAALAFDLFLQSAEAARQAGDLQGSLAQLDVLAAQRLPELQAAQVCAKRIAVEALLLPFSEQLQGILRSLRRFGMHWPAEPREWRVRWEVWRAERALSGTLDESGFAPAARADFSHWMAQLIVLASAGAPLAVQSWNLFAVLMAFMVRGHRRHGAGPGLAVSLASWASLRVMRFKDVRGAERYAAAALAWSRRLADPIAAARTDYLVYAYIYPLTRPRRGVLEPLRSTAERLFEVGQTEYGLYALILRSNHMVLGGESLEHVQAASAVLAKRAVGTHIAPYSHLLGRLLGMLCATGAHAPALEDEIAAVRAVLRTHPGLRFGGWTLWIAVLGLLGHFADVLAEAEHEASQDAAAVVDLLFFRGVAAAAIAARAAGAERRRQRRCLRACARQLDVWAERNADFEHMARGLRAERARVRGRASQALALFTQAARRAGERGYRHHAAFLHARKATLLAQLERRIEAAAERKQACALYEQWGAHALAAALRSVPD